MESVRRKTKVLWLAAAVVLAAVLPTYGQLIAGRSDDAEYAVYINVADGTPTPLFNLADNGFAATGVEGLAVDDSNRTVYVCSGYASPNRQWILSAHYDNRDFNDPSHIRLRKVCDISPFIRISGLAWDSNSSKLYATYPFASGAVEGLYEINLTTGAATVVYDFTSIASSIDVRGFDFNPADGYLYGTDLATTAPGRSLVQINLVAQTVNNIAGAGALTSVQSGLAIGGNKAYIVPDDDNTPAAPIKVYNLTTNLYEADIANPWTGDKSSAGAGWGPNALVVPAGSNLGTTLTGSPTNALEYEVGTQISYTVKFRNFGPADATEPVTYSIVLGGTATATINSGSITSTSGTAAEGPTGTIGGSLADLTVPLGAGVNETVTFTVTTTGAGTLTVTSDIPPGASTDNYLGNNTESYSHVMRVYPDTDVVFSTVQSSDTSLVPGGGGQRFEYDASSSTQKFRKAFRSPNGDYIGLWADLDGNEVTDNVYMVKDPGGTWAIGAREGVTEPTPPSTAGEKLGSMILNSALAISNNGHFAYCNDTSASTLDETAIVFDGTDHTVVAREGQPIPAFSAQGYVYPSGTIDSPCIDGMDRAAFRVAYIPSPAPAGQDTAILADNGHRLLAWEGVTIPAGQAGGATATWKSFDQDKLFMDCLGLEWLVQGDTNAATSADDVLVVNGTVVLQQGQGVTGLTGTIPDPSSTAGIIFAEMYGNGDWYCNGTTTVTTEDFVIKGHGTAYSLIARWGDPIYAGSSEHWSDTDGFSPTFFAVAANTQGDYAIVGRTDNSDIKKNVAAVLNGTTELFREGDRVDLNLDGYFEDDAFIDTWAGSSSDPYSALLTDDGDFYAIVNLRNNAGTFIGKAFVKIHATPSAMPTGADVLVTKTVSDNFLESVGQQTTFTIRVCNHGPDTATGVVLNDPLPAGFDFISATNGAAETAPGSNIVTATIASLPPCSCEDYQIVVQATAEGVWTNTASAVGVETDPNSGNNSASVDVTVENQADLSVTKVDDGGDVVGAPFTYTITITNNGPATATNVQMTDTLDPLTSFVSGTNGAHETTPGSRIVVTTIASILPGNSAVVEITVVGSEEALVTNTVSVFSDEVDLVPSNDTAFVDTLVGDYADVSVALQTDYAYRNGGPVAFSVMVANGGPNTATNVDLVITLDPTLDFVSGTGGAVENPPGSGNVEVTIPSIPVLGSTTIGILATATAPGTITLAGFVDPAQMDQADPDDANNTGNASARIGDFRNVELILSKLAGHPTSVANGAKDLAGNPVAATYIACSNLAISPDGTTWLARATTSQSVDEKDCLTLGIGAVHSIVAQEGQQVPGGAPTDLYDFFDSDTPGGFNSNNDWAYSARARGCSTGTCERVIRVLGGTPAELLRENSPLTGTVDTPPSSAGNETLGNSVGSVHLLNDNRTGYFVTPINNCSSTNYPGLFFDNAMHIQRTYSALGASTWAAISMNTFFTTPDGLHWLSRGQIEAGTTDPVVLGVDGQAAVLGGQVWGGVTIGTLSQSAMATDGTWFLKASSSSTATDPDVVIRSGVAVANTGLTVTGGTETWGNQMIGINGNSQGDYIVIGNTSATDVNYDTVVALNGTDIVVREGDPVDADGDGRFDDNVFASSFFGAYTFITDDKTVWSRGTLRNSEGTSLGDAIIRISLAVPATCDTVLGDANGSSTRNGVDVQAFVDCMLAGGTLAHPCKCADFDDDGDIEMDDLTAFATALVTDP